VKKTIPIILLLFSFLSFAQTTEITQLLNLHFQQEQSMYDEEYSNFKKPTLVQPFQIKNDTLSFEYSIPSYTDSEHILYTKRKVHLKDIKEFIKDVNVIFIANPKSVKETRTTKNTKGETLESTESFTYMFFTELRKDSYDAYTLRQQMLDAFTKAGYKITSEDWYN
jgi:hypothetical protein